MTLEQIFAVQLLLLKNLEAYGDDRPDIVSYVRQKAEEGMAKAHE